MQPILASSPGVNGWSAWVSMWVSTACSRDGRPRAT